MVDAHIFPFHNTAEKVVLSVNEVAFARTYWDSKTNHSRDEIESNLR